jgi:hypothetical protein
MASSPHPGPPSLKPSAAETRAPAASDAATGQSSTGTGAPSVAEAAAEPTLREELRCAEVSLPPESAPGGSSEKEAARAKRPYRRLKPFRFTPARRRAVMANLARGREVLRARGWPHSEKQLAAARANLSKAHAESREPKNYRRYHRHKLKHGLQVRSLEQTMRLLGEDLGEFEAHCERFRRVFAPAHPTEEKIVRRIACAAWRQLRLFKAQARWQADALRQYFKRAEFVQPLDAEATRLRALFLMSLLTDREKFLFHDQRLTGGVERALRTLLRLRSGGDPEFQLYSRQTEKERQEFNRLQEETAEERRIIEEEEGNLRFRERLVEGGPEVDRAIARVRRKLLKKT